MIRILLMVYNVVAVAILIYRLIQMSQIQMEPSRKRIIMLTGIVLLLLPIAMLLRFIPPSSLYFFIYPVGISLFVYLTWEKK